MDERDDRSLDDRASETRPESWTPRGYLPEIPKRGGYHHRWMRVSSLGESDPVNVSGYKREGWEICSPQEYPELADETSPDADRIEIGGLVLIRIPQERANARRRFYQQKSDQQLTGVHNELMSQSDPRMPLFRESFTTHSKG